MDTIAENGLSVVIPVYNENERLIRSLDTLFYNSIFLCQVFDTVEIIIVDDGSTNDIKSIVKSKKNEFQPLFNQLNLNINIKFVSYKQNKGKGYAVRTGIKYCVQSITWIMDCDLSIPLQDFISGTIQLGTSNYDAVLGNRKLKHSVVSNYSAFRRFLSEKYNTYVSKNIFKVDNTTFTDVQCPCKIFPTHIIKTASKYMTLNGFCYDTELLLILHIKKYNIKQIPVTFMHDSKDSKVKLFSSSLKMFIELQKIKKRFKKLL